MTKIIILLMLLFSINATAFAGHAGCIVSDWKLRKVSMQDIKVIDGDTIKIKDSASVRLQGIDAPELAQECYLEGKATKCGITSKEKLQEIISSNKSSDLLVQQVTRDKYRRIVAYLYIEQVPGTFLNVNQKMVADGYAIAYSYYDRSFCKDELESRQKKLGLFAGAFEDPSAYRAAARGQLKERINVK